MEDKYQKLSIKAKKSWFIARAIFLAILILITAIPLIFVSNNKIRLVIFIVMGILILLQLLNTLLYPIIEYNQWKYIITEERIELVHGIFFITTSVIPIVRIQNINIQEGPINRPLHLAGIEIITAGGNFSIPNIEKSKADDISSFLKRYINLKVENELEDNNGK